MFQEAMNVYRVQDGKIGIESSIMLNIAMIENGIKPNVVTFSSIIDACQQLPALEYGVNGSSQAIEYPNEQSSTMLIGGAFQNKPGEDRILEMFQQLASEKAGHVKKLRRGRQDLHCIFWLFQKMHELHIKPNVVTFSAILNACSRCNSYDDAAKLLDTLPLFDSQVYEVTHGLLMGYREQVWFTAQTLFNELMRMVLQLRPRFITPSQICCGTLVRDAELKWL
ncbi:unnamed protein product [Vicia faba]|uniref:Pentatricopeptide repeat-containing protein n=1 Tax=Vicia faba TaxID=3906 RepID=A0AAV0ZDE9_VICFA|nr:unnamed protein product [Vicia faba]